MKKSNLLLLFSGMLLLISLQGNAQSDLHQQLTVLNANWRNMALNDLPSPSVEWNEKTLIQLHLSLVEQRLREKKDLKLTALQRQNREQCLDILHDYWKAGIFPTNLYHQERTPYFIDDYGVACAVGHLLITTDHAEMAQQIKKENNYAYISELNKKYASLNQWANENGLSIDELAWIQPCYCQNTSLNGEIIHVSCFGGFDGSFNPAISSDWPPPYQIEGFYRWYNEEWISTWCNDGCNLSAGDYKCAIIDGVGETHDYLVTIIQPDSLYSNIEIAHESGNCDGSLLIDAVGGTPPYQLFSFTGGTLPQQIIDLCSGGYEVQIIDANGCQIKDSIFIESSTSIADISVFKYSLYPNPTQGHLHLEIENASINHLDLKIYDAHGMMLIEEKVVDNQTSLDLNFLDNGVYFIEIKNGSKKASQKIVKHSK